MKALNLTGESLKSSNTTVTSDTIRDDRNISDITVVGGGAGGDGAFELRYGDVDDLFEATLQGTWVETIASAGVANVNVSAAVIEADSSALVNVLADQVVRVSLCSTTANDGDFIVTAVSTVAGTTRLHVADASTGVAAAFTSETFDATHGRVYGKNLRNGVVSRSFTIEKSHGDVGLIALYTGMRATTLNLSLESQKILMGSFGFTGKGQTISSTTVASAVTAASTNDVMNASGNVTRLWEGGDAVTSIAFSKLTLSLNNNPREQSKVGSDVLTGVATGRCQITGTFSAYFENKNLIDKFVNGTATSLRFQVQDASGNAYIVSIPKVRLTDMTVVAGGPNTDVMQDGTWGAMVNTGGLYAIQIDSLNG